MKKRVGAIPVVFAILCTALVACRGTSTYTPSAEPGLSSGGDTAAAGTERVAAPSGALPALAPQLEALRPYLDERQLEYINSLPAKSSSPCTTVAPVPGTYVSVITVGKVKGTTYTASTKDSFWVNVEYERATPPPSPKPSSKPTATPTGVPTAYPTLPPINSFYIYEGAYSLEHHNGGCAIFFATQDGKPIIKGTTASAEGIGFPDITYTGYTKEKLIGEGSLDVTIGNLSKKGGSGTLTLTTETGAKYDTGKIVLGPRTLIPGF
jgi:hypothetical protein